MAAEGGHLAGEGGETTGGHLMAGPPGWKRCTSRSLSPTQTPWREAKPLADTRWQDLRDGKGALLEVYHQPSCLEAAENFLYVPLVLLHGGAGNCDIVQVDESECQLDQHPVHELLKGAAGVLQEEVEAQELDQSKWGDDGGLHDACSVHRNIKISFAYIN
jgi:hypothetical protein